MKFRLLENINESIDWENINISPSDLKNNIFKKHIGVYDYDQILSTNDISQYVKNNRNANPTFSIEKISPKHYIDLCAKLLRTSSQELIKDRLLDDMKNKNILSAIESHTLIDMPFIDFCNNAQEGLHRMIILGKLTNWDDSYKYPVLVVWDTNTGVDMSMHQVSSQVVDGLEFLDKSLDKLKKCKHDFNDVMGTIETIYSEVEHFKLKVSELVQNISPFISDDAKQVVDILGLKETLLNLGAEFGAADVIVKIHNKQKFNFLEDITFGIVFDEDKIDNILSATDNELLKLNNTNIEISILSDSEDIYGIIDVISDNIKRIFY